MASNSKRTEAIRTRKDKPNQKNLKKNEQRVERNRELLREFAARDQA